MHKEGIKGRKVLREGGHDSCTRKAQRLSCCLSLSQKHNELTQRLADVLFA